MRKAITEEVERTETENEQQEKKRRDEPNKCLYIFKVNIQACSSGMLLFIKQKYSAVSIPFI